MFNLFYWLFPKLKPTMSNPTPPSSGIPINSTTYANLKSEYQSMYDSSVVTASMSDVDGVVNGLISGKAQYENVGLVPWYVVALIHSLECDLDFSTHLFNGDPLRHRTVNEPVGQPLDNPDTPNGYSFKLSATRALQFDNLDKWTDWSIPGVLYKLESYNGFGYREYHKMYTPYEWSGTNFYTVGKYDRDGHFDPTLVSEEVGIVPILKRMKQRSLI